MSEVIRVKMQRFQESQNRKYNMDMRNLRKEYWKKYQNEVKSNESKISQIKDNFKTRVTRLEAKLHKRLNELRAKHKHTIDMENDRLKRELKDLRMSHESKRAEVEESQSSDIENLLASHEQVIKNAERKFEKERIKLEG